MGPHIGCLALAVALMAAMPASQAPSDPRPTCTDAASWVQQFVPRREPRTRAARRKAGTAARQPTCGTVLVVAASSDWHECTGPGSSRCFRISQTLRNVSEALEPLRANASVIYVAAPTDSASALLAETAATLAYSRSSVQLSAWFVPAMTISGPPLDQASLIKRVLVNSFELPDALTTSGEGMLLRFLAKHCALELPLAHALPGQLVSAVQEGDAPAVEALISEGATSNPANPHGEPCISSGWSAECFRPLHEAIRAAASGAGLDITRSLLRGGAAVQRRGADGQSLLQVVAMRWAEQKLPDVSAQDNPANIVAAWLMDASPIGLGQVDDLGQTVFHVAARACALPLHSIHW